MASLGEDIRAFLVASTAIAAASTRWKIAAPGVVEQNTIRQNAPQPRIWYQRAGESAELDLDGEGGLTESSWDLEVLTDVDDERWSIADAVRRALHGHLGAFGSRSVQGVFVEDHDDDYSPFAVASEEGEYVAAFRLTIFTT